MGTNPIDPLYQHFYVARQPIFNNSDDIWGYELLFRSGPEQSKAEISDKDLATIGVATCGFIKSQEHTDQTKKICINFTEKLLLEGAPRGLPPAVTVIEILEDIVPTPELVQVLIELKQEGYLLAIDDYEGSSLQKELLELADIIKIDILGKTPRQISDIFVSLEANRAIKLAEKVDNRNILNLLKKLGCDLYQGYYFATPETLTGRELKATEISKFRILQALEGSSRSVQEMAEIIETDPSITYRLLRFLNTAAFGFSIKITSVRHAILLLGTKRLNYWLRMVIMSELIGKHKTPELYMMALTRGRLLEELTSEGEISVATPETMFLFGMLSLIEAMLEMPINNILKSLPLSEELKSGYLSKESVYHNYLGLLWAVENADSVLIEDFCAKMKINHEKVAEATIRSIAWANTMGQHIM